MKRWITSVDRSGISQSIFSLMIISHSNIAEIINKARRDPTESARKKAHWCRGARAEQYCGTSPSDKRQLQTPAWRKHLQRLEQQRRQQCRRRPKCRTEHRLPVLLRGNRGNGADLLSWTTVLGEAGQVCEVSNQRVGLCGSSAVQCRQHCRYMPVSCCRSCAYLDKFSDEELLFAIYGLLQWESSSSVKIRYKQEQYVGFDIMFSRHKK